MVTHRRQAIITICPVRSHDTRCSRRRDELEARCRGDDLRHAAARRQDVRRGGDTRVQRAASLPSSASSPSSRRGEVTQPHTPNEPRPTCDGDLGWSILRTVVVSSRAAWQNPPNSHGKRAHRLTEVRSTFRHVTTPPAPLPRRDAMMRTTPQRAQLRLARPALRAHQAPRRRPRRRRVRRSPPVIYVSRGF